MQKKFHGMNVPYTLPFDGADIDYDPENSMIL